MVKVQLNHQQVQECLISQPKQNRQLYSHKVQELESQTQVAYLLEDQDQHNLKLKVSNQNLVSLIQNNQIRFLIKYLF